MNQTKGGFHVKEQLKVMVEVLAMFMIGLVIIGLINVVVTIPTFVTMVYGLMFGFFYAHPRIEKVLGKQ